MAPKDTLPKNWPSHLPFLSTPIFSKSLMPTQLSALNTKPPDTPSIPPNTLKGPCSLVKITPITDPSHPANGQSGLCATKDLKPGTFILQYIGEVHGSSDPSSASNDTAINPHAHSDYDLSLDRDHGIGIDADKKGNEARFINDYRGVAEKPNAEFREVWDERTKMRAMGVWVLPEGKNKGNWKGIKKAEEILASYGRGFWSARKEDGGAG